MKISRLPIQIEYGEMELYGAAPRNVKGSDYVTPAPGRRMLWRERHSGSSRPSTTTMKECAARFASERDGRWCPRLLPCSRSSEPVRLRCRSRPAPRRPSVQIRSAIPHPIAEAVEGGSVSAHAVAVQRAVREAEIIPARRASKKPLSLLPMLLPFDCRMCLTCGAVDPAPTATRAGGTEGKRGRVRFQSARFGKIRRHLAVCAMRSLPRDGAGTGRLNESLPKCRAFLRRPAGAIRRGRRNAI